MGRFNVLMTMAGLGFALLTGPGAFSAIAPGVAHATQQQTAPVGAEEGAQASVPGPSEPAAIR